MLPPSNLLDGFRLFVTSTELGDRFTAQAHYLRSADAQREELAQHPELRGAPDGAELAARLCEQRAALCEFIATHLPFEHCGGGIDAEAEVLLALPLAEFNALLPLLGFRLNVTVKAPAIRRPPPGGVPPAGRFVQ